MSQIVVRVEKDERGRRSRRSRTRSTCRTCRRPKPGPRLGTPDRGFSARTLKSGPKNRNLVGVEDVAVVGEARSRCRRPCRGGAGQVGDGPGAPGVAERRTPAVAGLAGGHVADHYVGHAHQRCGGEGCPGLLGGGGVELAGRAPAGVGRRSRRPPPRTTTHRATETEHPPRCGDGPAGPGSAGSETGWVTFPGAMVIGPAPRGRRTGGRG